MAVVGQAHRHGKGHRDFGLLAEEIGFNKLIQGAGIAVYTIIGVIQTDVAKVVPVDVGVPDIGLGVGDSAGPTFTRAEAFAGAQALGVFLPGDDEAGAWRRGDVDAVGVAAARGQAFGGAPGDVVDRVASAVDQWFARIVIQVLLQGAAGSPDAAVGDLAHLGEALFFIVHRFLVAGHAEHVVHVKLVGIGDPIYGDLVIEFGISRQEVDFFFVQPGVERRAACAEARDPGHYDAVALYNMHDLENVAGVFFVGRIQHEGRVQGGIRQVPVLPGGAVVQGEGREGIPLAETGPGVDHSAVPVEHFFGYHTVVVGGDDRLGLRAGVHQGAGRGVLVGAVPGIVLQFARIRVGRLALGILGGHVEGHDAHLRGACHGLRRARDVAAEQRSVVGRKYHPGHQESQQGYKK